MTAPLLTITYDEAKADLLELADKWPERVYEAPSGQCRYFTDAGNPSCIVGYVLAKHGIEVQQLVDAEGRLLNENADVEMLRHAGLIACDDTAGALLLYAQGEQDNANPWGPAVAYAIDSVEENL